MSVKTVYVGLSPIARSAVIAVGNRIPYTASLLLLAVTEAAVITFG